MINSFTGTQTGMSDNQLDELRSQITHFDDQYLPQGGVTEIHHGDCIGSDDEFHKLITNLITPLNVVTHPSNIDSKRAFNEADVIHEVKPPLERNKDIARACDILFATPKEVTTPRPEGQAASIVRKGKHER